MRRIDTDLVDKSIPEHGEMKRLIAELHQLRPEDRSYDATVMELMRDVLRHVANEETKLLPDAERVLGERRLAELGAQMTRRRMELAAPHMRDRGRQCANLPGRCPGVHRAARRRRLARRAGDDSPVERRATARAAGTVARTDRLTLSPPPRSRTGFENRAFGRFPDVDASSGATFIAGSRLARERHRPRRRWMRRSTIRSSTSIAKPTMPIAIMPLMTIAVLMFDCPFTSR